MIGAGGGVCTAVCRLAGSHCSRGPINIRSNPVPHRQNLRFQAKNEHLSVCFTATAGAESRFEIENATDGCRVGLLKMRARAEH